MQMPIFMACLPENDKHSQHLWLRPHSPMKIKTQLHAYEIISPLGHGESTLLMACAERKLTVVLGQAGGHAQGFRSKAITPVSLHWYG